MSALYNKPVSYLDSTVEDLKVWLETRKFEDLLFLAEARHNSDVHIYLENIPAADFEKPDNRELISRSAIKKQCPILFMVQISLGYGTEELFGPQNGSPIRVFVCPQEFCEIYSVNVQVVAGR